MRIVASCLFALLMLWNSNTLAQHSHTRVYATAIANDSAGAFMGGSSNGSGLYQSDDTGKTWRHLGWNNIKAYSMDEVQSSNGRILYLATGLGVLRSNDFGEHWKVTTDWRFAEVMDVAVNQKNPDEIYVASAHGPWRTKDGGASWQALSTGLTVPYCSRVVIDSVVPNHVMLASENGIYSLQNDSVWKRLSAYIYSPSSGVTHQIEAIRSLEQITARYWIAAGACPRVLESYDSGMTFHAGQYGGEDSTESLWCACTSSQVSSMAPYGRMESWAVILLGEAGGYRLEWNSSADLAWNRNLIDSIRYVHTCLSLVDTSSTLNYVSLLGTLGDGVFARKEAESLRLSREAHLSSRSRKVLIGEQSLGGREIWTLKAYLIRE